MMDLMMNRTRFLILVAILAVAVCSILAVPFIPGTSFYSKRLAKITVADMLSDPSSAQFKDVVTGNDNISRNNLVCGEVNGRNGFGAYAGYRRFAFEVAAKSAFIDPGVTYSDEDAQREDKSCGVDAYTSRCTRAREIDDAIVKQAAFNGGWDAACAALYRKP